MEWHLDTLHIFASHPRFSQRLTLNSLLVFIRLLTYLRPFLSWQQSPFNLGPPITLHNDFQLLFASVLRVEQADFLEFWSAFSEYLWRISAEGGASLLSRELVDVLMEHGVPYDIGTSLCLHIAPFPLYVFSSSLPPWHYSHLILTQEYTTCTRLHESVYVQAVGMLKGATRDSSDSCPMRYPQMSSICQGSLVLYQGHATR